MECNTVQWNPLTCVKGRAGEKQTDPEGSMEGAMMPNVVTNRKVRTRAPII